MEANSWGFREKEVGPKRDGIKRVMVLGDSLTWGAGLPVGERYTDILGKRLEKDGIEVLNFGISGGSTADEVMVLGEYIEEVKPDLIVVGFCVNDPQKRDQDWSIEKEEWAWLYWGVRGIGRIGYREAAGELRRVLNRTLEALEYIPDWNEALDRAYDEYSDSWRDWIKSIEDIRELSDGEDHKAPLFVPLLQGSGDYNYPSRNIDFILDWTRRAGAAAERAGFKVVWMEKEFEAEGPRNRNVNKWDGHPDAQCNRVYADVIERAIRETFKEEK